MNPTRCITAAFAALCAAHTAWAWIPYSSNDDFWPYGYESAGSSGIVFKSPATVTSAAGATTYLTVNGAADLSNATVEVAGGELIADAADETEIVLLKATGDITWTKTSYVIPGQDRAWTIKTGTVTESETTYNVLKAGKTPAGLILIIK